MVNRPHHHDPSQALVITGICVTDITVGLRRIPVGFHVSVHADGTEWRTANKPISVDASTIEWEDRITLPLPSSANVHFRIGASFEFTPVLGNGTSLRELDVSVEELLDRSEAALPFAFSPEDGELVSSCTSLLVTVVRGHVESNEATHVLRFPDVDSVTRRLTDVTDDGQGALTRYRKDQEPRDLVSSIERFTHAVDLCPPDHACFPVVLFNLAVAQLIHCQAIDDDLDVDIDVPITLFRDVLDLRPTGHPDRPAALFHLAVACLTRFHRQGDQANVNEARELLSQVMEFCPIESYYHRSAFVTLEMSAIDRVVGSIAIDSARDVVQSTSNHDPDEADNMGDTALFYLGRFQELGQLVDLNRAISLLTHIVHLTGDNDPNRLSWLLKLAMSHSIRFSRLDQLSDLTKSISTLEDTLPLCPNDNARAGSLNNLGHLLRKRFELLGDLDDIQKSVSALEDAVRLTPDDPHTDKPNMLGNLSASLKSRYERLGDLADVDRAISVAEDVLRRIPEYHPNTVRALNTLGASLQARFECLGDLADINRSIAVLENVIRITPDGHPDKPTCLSHMGGSLLRRFERLGDLADIHASISVLEQSVRLTPDEPSKFGNLGYSLSVRFQRLGDVADIHRAISLLEDAVRRLPESDPSKLAYQSNLSRALVDRFELLGDIKDIDEAVAHFEDVTRLMPKDHPESRANLGNCLWRRFQRLGDPADLKKAVSASENALAQTPKGHPGEAWAFSNLGGLLIDCFKLSGDIADINRAVSMQEQALQLVPDDHADKPAMLSNFCSALSTRFQFSDDLADTHKAISCYEDALRLLPEDHAYRGGFLHNLGSSLLLRFDRLGDKADIDKAISVLEEAVRRTPDEHPIKAFRLNVLGSAFFARFTNSDDLSALPSARSHFSLAARSSAGASSVRFEASKWWIATNQLLEGDALDAYELAIGLLPQLAWIGLPLQDRHRALHQAADIARDAAASAIALRRTQTAVEWLEQGRSIVWGQLLQLRTPLDELRETYPALAERLMHVSKELELVSARDPLLHLGRTGDLDTASPEQQARRHRTLAKERDDLLLEVRSSPGFERFLLPKTFAQLTAAAHSGPIVILNASKRRCDALIVTASADDPLHVPLPNITYSEAVGLQTMLENMLENNGRLVSVPEPDRAVRLASKRLNTKGTFKRILSELWRKAVRPVLEGLGYLIPGQMRRIFWCPTGPFAFLPIHAAGLYGTNEPGKKASDFVISSYSPTLDALILPLQDHVATTNLRILAVPQPDSDGQVQLPGTRREIAHLQNAVDALSSPHITITLLQSTGTVEDVLAQMTHAHWVHFACHGIQDRLAPLDSGLMLAMERRLKLSDIIQLSSRPREGLAFLSACQTATGDRALSEEAVHLAAGMLLAGYRSVIATMWSIGDSDAPEVAQSVYEQLFTREGDEEGKGGGDGDRERGMPDARRAAQALHVATARLRARDAPFMSWVPFIHVGL